MSDFPQEISQLLESNQFQAAIDKCPDFGISPELVQEYIRNKVKKAGKLVSTDPDKAIEIYTNLIGVIEPSVVLCRFFAPHLSNYLARYLIELHIKGYAETQHTKLLFNLFHHANNRPLLEKFIQMLKIGKEQIAEPTPKNEGFSFFKGSTRQADNVSYVKLVNTFDATSAIEVLRQNDMDDDAFTISEMMNISTHKIALLIQTAHYKDAAQAIEEKAEEPSGFAMLLEFGPALLSLPPSDDAFAIANIIENTAIRIWSTPSSEKNPIHLFRLFYGRPASALNVLKKITRHNNDELFLDALIMLQIPIRTDAIPKFTDPKFSEINASSFFFGNEKIVNAAEALKLIETKPLTNIDQLLFYCTEVGFTEGVRALLLKKQRFSEITAMLIDSESQDQISEWYLEREDVLPPNDLLNIFQFFAKQQNPNQELLSKIITKIVSSDIVPLAYLLEQLCNNDSIPFSVIQTVFESQTIEMSLKLQDEEIKHNELNQELAKLEEKITVLEGSDFEFKPRFCDLCKQVLETPSIGFFCKHNFHKKCAECDEGGNYFCPLCHALNSPEYTISRDDKKNIDTNADVVDQAVTLVENGFFL